MIRIQGHSKIGCLRVWHVTWMGYLPAPVSSIMTVSLSWSRPSPVDCREAGPDLSKVAQDEADIQTVGSVVTEVRRWVFPRLLRAGKFC